MTRQSFDTIDVLHLEVERPPATGELVNLIPNPSGAEGAWGWTSPEISTFVRKDPTNLEDWLEFNTGSSSTPSYYTDPLPVTPGHKITGRYRWRGADSNPTPPVVPTFTLRFYDSTDAAVGSTASSTPSVAGARYLPVSTVPTGATTARLEVTVTRGGAATNAGDASFLSEVMVTTAADPDAFGLTRTNLLANPSLEANLDSWSRTPVNSTNFERVAKPGTPSQWALRIEARSNINLINVTLQSVDVTAGLPYTFSIAALADTTTRSIGLRMQWLRSDGSTAGLQNASITNGSEDGVWKRSSMTQTAPTDAVSLRTLVLYGSTPAGETHYLDDAMVEQTDTAKPYIGGSRGGENFAYAEPAYYFDVLGPTHEITVEREALNVGVLSATILDAALDPAQGELIRPGKRVRLRSDDGVIFTGKVQSGRTTYDPTRSDTKRARVVLTAVDAVTRLASTARPAGVGTVAELPVLLEGTGVPWSVNGSGDHVTSATIVSANDNASALDQIGITRDSVLGYAWVDRLGVLRINDRDEMPTETTALTETAYSALDLSYSTEDCINEVRIRSIQPPNAEGRSEEIAYGPYRDLASISEWGARSAEFTVAGIPDPATYAAAILAANATPALRVNAVTLPVRDTVEIARASTLDLYDLAAVTSAGTTHQVRITGLRHTISPDAWMVDLTFSGEGSVAAPNLVAPPSAGVDGVSYTERIRPIGEVTMFHGSSAPTGWLVCNGATFSATDYPKLAALLGGTTLPDFRDRVPFGVGNLALGAAGGSTVHTHALPNHAHTFSSAGNTATVSSGGAARINGYTNSGASTSGSSNHMPPYLTVHFIIRAS